MKWFWERTARQDGVVSFALISSQGHMPGHIARNGERWDGYVGSKYAARQLILPTTVATIVERSLRASSTWFADVAGEIDQSAIKADLERW